MQRRSRLTGAGPVRAAVAVVTGADAGGKPPGFVALGPAGLAIVDVAVDPYGPWPLPDGSVNRFVAIGLFSRPRQVPDRLREIYRVCAHGARVCLVAPFGRFNEHTPRFWTADPEPPPDAAGLLDSLTPAWGLARPGRTAVDFRTLSWECLPTPTYVAVPEPERRLARRRYAGVCDVIAYNLMAWKPPVDEAGSSVAERAAADAPCEPPLIAERRTRDQELAAQIAGTPGSATRARRLLAAAAVLFGAAGPARAIRGDARTGLPEAVATVIDNAVRAGGTSDGARLDWSGDLRAVPYYQYAMAATTPFDRVTLLATPVMPASQGRIGVEVVGHDGRIPCPDRPAARDRDGRRPGGPGVTERRHRPGASLVAAGVRARRRRARHDPRDHP